MADETKAVQNVKIHATLLAIVLLGTCARYWAEPHASCNSQGLDTTVPGPFVVDEPLAAAILELGRTSRVCFGLRLLDANAFTHVLHINAKDASVRQILDAMLKDIPDYVFQESSFRVVLIGKLNLKARDLLLDRIVPKFDTPQAPLNTILNALQMQVAVDLDPTITGFAGSYSTGDVADQVGPIEQREKKIWELLNEIVGQSRGAMWIASAPESAANYPKLHPWEVVEYTLPHKQALEAIQCAGSQF